MNLLHESVIGNFENCLYFYFAGYIDPWSWRALFLRDEVTSESIVGKYKFLSQKERYNKYKLN